MCSLFSSVHLKYTKRDYDTINKILKGNMKMIKRRQFLIFGTLLGVSPYLKAKEFNVFEKAFQEVEATIAGVQEHLFPRASKLPSAKKMNSTQFVFETMTHKSFDKDIREFVLDGAKELISRENGHFVAMSSVDKEKALRAYEETNYGSSWLSRIMTLTMEGMFCDPIYGSNVKEAGWKALHSFGGQPRPDARYLDV